MKKIEIEIDVDVCKDLRRYLKKHYNYNFSGTDKDLTKCFIDSIETLPPVELVQILLGDCDPVDLLGSEEEL